MAPTHRELADVPVLFVQNQVIFPYVRDVVEIPSDAFSQVHLFLEQTNSDCIGVVTARPFRRGEGLATKRTGVDSDDSYEVGTLCHLVSHSVGGTGGKKGDAKAQLVLEGVSRFRPVKYTQTSPVRLAVVQPIEEDDDEGSVNVRALVNSVREKVAEFVKLGGEQEGGGTNGQPGLLSLKRGRQGQVQVPSKPSMLVGMVGTALTHLSVEERQKVLATIDVKEQLKMILDLLQRESGALKMSSEIASNIQRSREAEMKKVILEKQIQEVQKELRRVLAKSKHDREAGEGDDASDERAGEDEDAEADELSHLAERLSDAGLSADASRIAKRELKKLKSLPPHHPEYTSTYTYLELLSGLPWNQSSKDRFDLSRARAILDEDHQGLEKVKTRILEFLAVQKMRGHMKGPILCLHGPPGIGKTSLGRSIARALNRKFHRIALGGVRDEAELRGHRRTYIGSMPGVVIQALSTLGVNNPVILLDEVDKMSNNAMFNPQASLLEILDPEQNDSFKDHYLNTPFDLSRVLFICTANDSSLIDRPLLDRMEVLELSGYTVDEKIAITTTHLLPKQRRLHALEAEAVPSACSEVPQEAPSPAGGGNCSAEEPRLVLTPEAISNLVTRWTAESGVRSLERRLAQLCRWAALRLQGVKLSGGEGTAEFDAEREAALSSCGPHGQRRQIVVDAHHLQHIIGAELFDHDIAERLEVGVAMGLSVSATGGQLLFIEACRCAGSGRLTITGQLGKVMTESVETALSLLRSHDLSVDPAGFDPLVIARGERAAGAHSDGRREIFKEEDLHVHFPAGAIPKDGPSAGVAVLLALTSLHLGRPMRSDTAVSGEVTLRGHVLAVGGVRDKVLAAHRAGIKHVLLPMANKRHVLDELPESTLRAIEIHYIKHVDEAIRWCFGEYHSAKEQADVRALETQNYAHVAKSGVLYSARSRL
mmetsp:Transcript_74779/g.207945  ORF Transcript_74779/g.207945 Transcript_74779/m.207945 type:complete len:938 (+) Transcript_74779:72-2885(+)